jgi:hypothetical protein
MSQREKEEQMFDLAYSNLAMSTNHQPSRSAFAKLAANRGWSMDEFEAWAATKTWGQP